MATLFRIFFERWELVINCYAMLTHLGSLGGCIGGTGRHSMISEYPGVGWNCFPEQKHGTCQRLLP